jgi:hypothetical protein
MTEPPNGYGRVVMWRVLEQRLRIVAIPCCLIILTTGKACKQIWHMAEMIDVSMRLDQAEAARRFGTWVQLFASGLLAAAVEKIRRAGRNIFALHVLLPAVSTLINLETAHSFRFYH